MMEREICFPLRVQPFFLVRLRYSLKIENVSVQFSCQPDKMVLDSLTSVWLRINHLGKPKKLVMLMSPKLNFQNSLFVPFPWNQTEFCVKLVIYNPQVSGSIIACFCCLEFDSKIQVRYHLVYIFFNSFFCRNIHMVQSIILIWQSLCTYQATGKLTDSDDLYSKKSFQMI